MVLIDGMIRCRRFKEFCLEIIRIRNEEKEEDTLWEFYLHRVFDKTFDEFLSSIKEQPDKKPSSEEIKSTILDSRNMLSDFHPE